VQDGRQVFLMASGSRTSRATGLPRRAGSLARLFDLAPPENGERMTFPSPRTEHRAARLSDPRTHADLRARRLFSETGGGDVRAHGRTLDQRRGIFLRLCRGAAPVAAAGQQFADNVWRSTSAPRRASLSELCDRAEIDRASQRHKQSDPTLHAGVVKERDGACDLRAQQLATGGCFRLLHLSCIHPLQPGDENYATASLSDQRAGLKLYSRRAFAREGTNAFDYP